MNLYNNGHILYIRMWEISMTYSLIACIKNKSQWNDLKAIKFNLVLQNYVNIK